MAIYNRVNSTIVQKELPIFGLSRLGVYSKADNSSSYQITDHLGNVRAVIKKINGTPEIQLYADYYPFGEQLPARNTTSNYRYAFQGQEKDPETGMEAFQLRLWDGRIGRWLSKDPKHQYASPYIGMGNNPISLVDPDGGSTEDWYKDKNGVTRFDNNVKNQADVDRISPGGKYIAPAFSTKTANYYSDGSAFFKDEHEGYKFMLDNSNMQKGKNEVEHLVLLLRMVLPFYQEKEKMFGEMILKILRHMLKETLKVFCGWELVKI